MKFLSIDTSRATQSISVFDSSSSSFLIEKIQESKSSVFVSELIETLTQANISAQDFSQLLLVTGPGSFTGIRTGMAIIKTLAAELDLDIFAVNNFELLRFEQNLTSPIAINAGLNDYYISLDTDYMNAKTNFFATELGSSLLVDFKAENISKLLIDYFLQKPDPKLVKYEALQPYYLREPSVGLLSSKAPIIIKSSGLRAVGSGEFTPEP